MADCPLLEACPFFAGTLKDMPATADLLKHRYCRGEYERCARFAVREALGKEHVPGDLFPYDRDRANDIVKRHGK